MNIYYKSGHINYTFVFDLSSIKIFNRNTRKYIGYHSLNRKVTKQIQMFYNNFLISKITKQNVSNLNYIQSCILSNRLSLQQSHTICKLLNKERLLSKNIDINKIIETVSLNNVSIICSDKQTGKTFIPLELSHYDFDIKNIRLSDNQMFINTNIIVANNSIIDQWKGKLSTFYRADYLIIRTFGELNKLLITRVSDDDVLTLSDRNIIDCFRLDYKHKIIDTTKLKDIKIVLLSNKVFQSFMFYSKQSKLIFPRLTIDSFYSLNVGMRYKHCLVFYNQLFINIYLMSNNKHLLLQKPESKLFPARYLFNYLNLIYKFYLNKDNLDKQHNLLLKQQTNLKVSIETSTDINALFNYQAQSIEINNKIIHITRNINKRIRLIDNIVIYNEPTCLTYKKTDTIVIKSYNYYDNGIIIQFDEMNELLEAKEYKLVTTLFNIKLLMFDRIKKTVLFNKNNYYNRNNIYGSKINMDFTSNSNIISSLHKLEKLKNETGLLFEEYYLNLGAISDISDITEEVIKGVLLEAKNKQTALEEEKVELLTLVDESIEEKNANILERINDVEECSICYSKMECPLVTSCCKNVYCLTCYLTSYNNNHKCLNCRADIDLKNQMVIKDKLNTIIKYNTIDKITRFSKYKPPETNLNNLLYLIKTECINPKIIFVTNDSIDDDKLKSIKETIIQQNMNLYAIDYNKKICSTNIHRFNQSLINCLIMSDWNYYYFLDMGFNIVDLDYIISYKSNIYFNKDTLPSIINREGIQTTETITHYCL